MQPQMTASASVKDISDTISNNDAGMSPRSANRARIQSVTMPRFPDFDIPPSPPPPEPTSEEASALLARTRKFERFLELKKQGTHFNDRLEGSTALRNPALFQKLMDFAGIEPEEQYGNTLGDAFGVPMTWPDGFLEGLLRDNEKRLKKEKETRTGIDFVAARNKPG